MNTHRVVAILASLSVVTGAFAQTDDIQLNQIGFYPNEPKVFVARGVASVPYQVLTHPGHDTVAGGVLSAAQIWPYSGLSVSQGEFSSLTATGRYVIQVPGLGLSHPFDIMPRVHQSVATAALKAYYFQRASLALTQPFAGSWARAGGHPDTAVYIHASAATIARPESSTIAAPQGWYDAGDYNKYVVNSGISTSTLLSAYEAYPQYYSALQSRIPESSNGVPDILDEALWNIRWMLAMQDPGDGGVYVKLTNREHDYYLFWVMPAQDVKARYVVMKSTAATLNFASVMAQAARVFEEFDSEFPGLADSCLAAAMAAWGWAREHPAVYYDQDLMNQLYDPNITTGQYADTDIEDEFAWAAAELFVTTGLDSFLVVANPMDEPTVIVPNWQHVRTLGLLTLARHWSVLAGTVDTTLLKSRLLALANSLHSSMTSSAYGVVMGTDASDFVWGSNGVAANQGVVLLNAFSLSGETKYRDAALSNLDYLLGRNATAYCFVTDFGSRSPLHIHHRMSQVDGVVAPVPGLLVGGPNPGQQDGQTYPSPLPGLSYVDNFLAYASNEVAINWNAAWVYLSGGLEAELAPDGLPTAVRDQPSEAPPGTFELLENYPNPFNPETTIEYRVPQRGVITVGVYDVLGREVKRLKEGWAEAGTYQLRFSASGLSSGVYLCRLVGAGFARTIKMIVAK